MQGATEYARMFRTGQYGKLYLVSGSHARGETFHIWVLPTDEPIEGKPWSLKDAVEVYGIIGGQPGWTETYGWLHKGKWVDDFNALVQQRKAEIEESKLKLAESKKDQEFTEQQRVNDLLSKY